MDTKKLIYEFINECESVMVRKGRVYGDSVCGVYRREAFTDQLMIKALRIKQLQTSGQNNVGDTVRSEYVGIYNYANMCLVTHFQGLVSVIGLRSAKDADYGSAWLRLRQASVVDFILSKVERLRHIEFSGAEIEDREVAAIYADIANYAMFGACLLEL